MGASMLQGWLSKNLVQTAYIIDPNGVPEYFTGNKRVIHESNIDALPFKDIDLVILAIKPQIMAQICKELADHIHEATPLLSIAAGQSLSGMAQHFKEGQPIIRSMPNTPAAIGAGMSAAISNHTVSHETKALVQALLRASGEFIWLDNEPLMDAVTALSGSGPAYVFHLIETLSKAGERIGLSAEQAAIMARQTVIGSASLAAHDSKTTPSELRKNVTSPGGTTEAALKVLMDGRLQDIYDEALLAAKNRGIELSKK